MSAKDYGENLTEEQAKDLEAMVAEEDKAEELGDDCVETNLVHNSSKAYGYNYASLADMANAGVKIPKMKVGLVEGHEYIFWREGGEWLQGARIVVPEMKGANDAQRYGSAITYARRVTVAMSQSVATTDDKDVERSEVPRKSWVSKDDKYDAAMKPFPATDKQVGYLKSLLEKLDTDAETIEGTLEKARANGNKCSEFIEVAKKRLESK